MECRFTMCKTRCVIIVGENIKHSNIRERERYYMKFRTNIFNLYCITSTNYKFKIRIILDELEYYYSRKLNHKMRICWYWIKYAKWKYNSLYFI